MKNKYEIRGDTTAIYIPYKGKVIEAIIDTSTLTLVDSFPNTWFLNSNQPLKYAAGFTQSNKNRTLWLMHRLILNAPKELDVDHINHHTLDNRLVNLRLATTLQNMQNRIISRNNKSGVRGVHWDEKYKRWIAQVRIDNIPNYLGSFTDLDEATEAVKKARSAYMPFSSDYRKIPFDPNEKILRSPTDPKKGNKSGFRNVGWSSIHNKWVVRINVNKKELHFGTYKELNDAVIAAEQARKKYLPQAAGGEAIEK